MKRKEKFAIRSAAIEVLRRIDVASAALGRRIANSIGQGVVFTQYGQAVVVAQGRARPSRRHPRGAKSMRKKK